MKRAGRWLFNLAAGVSAVVFVATMAIWFMTLGTLRWVAWSGRECSIEATSDRNLLRLAIDLDRFDPDRVPGWDAGSTRRDLNALWSELDRFKWQFESVGKSGWGLPASGIAYRQIQLRWGAQSGSGHSLYVPHWLLLSVVAVIPGIWTIRFLRARHSTRHGHCPKCGYDLRATPDRCPECGEVPENAKGATA